MRVDSYKVGNRELQEKTKHKLQSYAECKGQAAPSALVPVPQGSRGVWQHEDAQSPAPCLGLSAAPC